MDFNDWCKKVREMVVARCGAEADNLCGANDDMRGYFDDGYTPERAAEELISYAAQAA